LSFEADIVTREQVDAVMLLPPPPNVGSPAQKRDMQIVIEEGIERTPEQAAKAVADDELSAFRFADVLGPHFTAAELPVTAKFFQQVRMLQRAVLLPASKAWHRPRPFLSNPELHPLGELPTSGSYPSWHSHFG
jgi:acid phosphatase (class A)